MLKLTYDSKDQVPEKFLELYSEKGGKFVLNQIDGMKTQEDVDKIQGALQKERELKRTAESAVAAFDGIESAGLRDQLDELARLRITGGKVDDDKIEGIVSERLKLDKAKHERDLERVNSQLSDANTKNQILVNEKNTSLIETQLREASAGQVNETAINDVLFRSSLFEVSENGSVVTKDGVGVTPGQEPKQWLEDTLKTNAHWQKTTSGAGARGNAGGSNGSHKDAPMTIQQIVEDELQFN